MPKNQMLEALESRQMLAADITLGPNNMYFNAVTGQSQDYTLRVVNTGDKRVILKGIRFVGDNNDASHFKVIDFPSGGRSIGAGGQVNYTVRFTSPGSYDKNIKAAQLRLYTDIPSKRGVSGAFGNGYSDVVPVRGMITKGTSGANEPSLQKIFNLYGLPIDSGETDPENYKYPSNPSSTSDEINAQTFVKAGAGNVTITPLAVFTNATNPAIRMGTYTPGNIDSAKYLWYTPSETSQSVNPYFFGTTKFDPGSTEFGIVTQYPAFYNAQTGGVQNVYSEKALNAVWSDSSSYNHFRVFPYVNSRGEAVANTYIVAQEEYGVTNVADNNDAIFIVTNVKPVTAASPTLSLQNQSALPDNRTLLFNRIQIPNADVGNIVRSQNSLKIRNTGSAPLVVSLGLTGDYAFASGGGSNISIAPGGSHEVKINFTATSGTAVHNGALTITSNDPANASVNVALRGNWQQYSEQAGPGQASVEPSSAKIINDLFGYTSNIPSATRFEQTIKNNIMAEGDQITAEYFQAADSGPDARVFITEIATFHSQAYEDANGNQVATNSFMGWYTKSGSSINARTVIVDKAGTGQMILPTPNSGNATGTTSGSFRPGTQTFGFSVEYSPSKNEGEFSEYALNGNKQYLRFFIARDANGLVIPNTYIMLHDYNRPTLTNFDFNDSIYLISGIVPVNKTKGPMTSIGYRENNTSVMYWSGAPDGPRITGYNVYRSNSAGGTYSLLTGTPLNARPSMGFRDDSATSNSTTYYYAIEAVGPNGASDRVYVKI